MKEQSKKLKGIKFKNITYNKIPKSIKNAVIYCDPPYRGTTTKYKDGIDYEDFYNWCRCMSEHNTVLISEYNMPEDFKCIWKHQHKTTLNVRQYEKR